MKKKLFLIFFLIAGKVLGQVDTLNPLTSKQIADSIYQSLDAFIPTGKLYNRLLIDTTESYSWLWPLAGTNMSNMNPATSDIFYGILFEQKNMSIDTSDVPNLLNLFNTVNSFVGGYEFDEKKQVYPMGILDYQYNYLNEQQETENGNIASSNHVLSVINQSFNLSAKKIQLAAPLYDYQDSPEMGFYFSQDYFYSNYRTSTEIEFITIKFNGVETSVYFDDIYFFIPNADSIQQFKITVHYFGDEVIENYFTIQTPDLKQGENITPKAGFPDCTPFLIDNNNFIEINGNKIDWCLIPRCGYDGRILKPYLLLTGYRPPILAQSYEKTWSVYNDEHGDLMNDLRANNYDIFIVRFNIHAKPFSHGMLESAELLAKFIEQINIAKNAGRGHENVIQGSSMSADIARLTLLQMEKKHLEDDSYPHHHSRLFIAYDANFYGANLPLAYQYQIISHVKHPAMNNIGFDPVTTIINNVYNGAKWLLSLYLYSTLEQKTVKELVMYHAMADNPSIFNTAVAVLDVTPKTHPLRTNFYNALQIVDNGQHIFPMPIATRNISISLGKISETNTEKDTRFLTAGDTWINTNLLIWQFRLRSAKYTPANSYIDLFIRRKISLSFWGSPFVHHKVNVSQMQEIDNASGSFLPGAGNLIQVGNYAYFPLQAIAHAIAKSDFQFSHKSVVTALGINKNLWPANGSMTLDMHSLGLMYVDKLPNAILISSNYFGYPNLGRPNDHFQITPFEAIYVDNKINPHISYNKPEDQPDVPFVNDFVLNEVEPWHLGLQNTSLGSKARSNYVYHSYRRAKHSIVVGHLVTPTTDPGDFVTEPNAALTLKAGDEIVLKPGVHFKSGSQVHIVAEYEQCNDFKRGSFHNEGDNAETREKHSATEFSTDPEKILKDRLRIYPNPGTTMFWIESIQEQNLKNILVHDLRGTQITKVKCSEQKQLINTENWQLGIYIVTIELEDGTLINQNFIKL